MDEFIQITCPCCKTILIIERRMGKIVEERRPILEQSTGDRYQDALKKVKERTSLAEEKFRKAKEAEKAKKEKLEKLFQEKLKDAKDSGEEIRPFNPYDLE